jgi:hypothetical protein
MARSKGSRGKPDVDKLLNRFAKQEDDFLNRQFLAPALRGGIVRVRIAGVVCRIRVEPADFAGWGVFQPLSHTEAILARPATLAERRDYLELFPLIRLIVCRRSGPVWYGSAASLADTRIHVEGLAPIDLADEVQLFDTVCTRYDGARFWFDELDLRSDPSLSANLREAFHERREPKDLQRRGLTAEQRAAYELSYWDIARVSETADAEGADPGRRGTRHPRRGRDATDLSESDAVRHRLRESLSHAGAQLVDYLERADSFRVTFSVGDQHYTSSVDKDDLTVQVAGICLSGEDRKFDLSSLVGVLREGGRMGAIYPDEGY